MPTSRHPKCQDTVPLVPTLAQPIPDQTTSDPRFKLLHGPYSSPPVKIGEWLECEIRGELQVSKWTEAPIPWPIAGGTVGGGFRGRGTIILCGDLVQAVECESSLAIQHWWGVSVATVLRWRRALGVKRNNEGTKRLFQEVVAPAAFTSAVTAQAIAKAATPQVRLKALQTSRERGKLLPRDPWTLEEEALLGEFSDKETAELLERPVNAVKRRRNQLGITASHIPAAVLSANSDLVAIVPAALQKKRLALNLTQQQVAEAANMQMANYRALENGYRRFAKKDRLALVAHKLQCKPSTLIDHQKEKYYSELRKQRQEKLNTEQQNKRQFKEWIPEEDALLGTMPDPQVAEQLGCTVKMVKMRRYKLGVPAYKKI